MKLIKTLRRFNISCISSEDKAHEVLKRIPVMMISEETDLKSQTLYKLKRKSSLSLAHRLTIRELANYYDELREVIVKSKS